MKFWTELKASIRLRGGEEKGRESAKGDGRDASKGNRSRVGFERSPISAESESYDGAHPVGVVVG